MHALLPEAEIFRRTGIKTNFYNTSLQLLAELDRGSPSLAHAERLLFVPDLLAYWLTGVAAVERTNASTSQLVDPSTGDWAWDVIRALGLPERPFGKIIAPGTVLGRAVGAGVGVLVPAGLTDPEQGRWVRRPGEFTCGARSSRLPHVHPAERHVAQVLRPES